MPPQVAKPDDFREICEVDIDPLREQLGRIGDAAWNAEDARKENRFDCFRRTRHIIARFIPANRDPMAYYATPFWIIWEPLLRPILERVARHYDFAEAEFPKVMLARLAAHACIDRHVDGAGSNLLTHKIHVPLLTNGRVWFEVGDSHFQLAPGYAYELNNLRPHAVRNEGDTDRLHLIFEIFDRARHQQAAA
jgi:hypothetical protein